MRSTASIAHLDLDAFFAAVEQRDKPSLRNKPVIVGGVGNRGVVATASYEARKYGVHSAMSTAQARARCPKGAFLSGRMDAYKQSSKIVMYLLRQLSPIVEQVSVDEAFVDLGAGGVDITDLTAIEQAVVQLRSDVVKFTGGLTASVGVGSSKFMAKLGSEMAKPDGYKIITPGTEVSLIADLPIRAIPGVGAATQAKLDRLSISTIKDLRKVSVAELSREVGVAAGESLARLAYAQDDREVVPVRQAKSISVEDTFETDLTDFAEVAEVVVADANKVADRLVASRLFAKTITVKIRTSDFNTVTRSRTLIGATDSASRIASVAKQLVNQAEVFNGIRLLGVGVSNFTVASQEELFSIDDLEIAAGTEHHSRALFDSEIADFNDSGNSESDAGSANLASVAVNTEASGKSIEEYSTESTDLDADRSNAVGLRTSGVKRLFLGAGKYWRPGMEVSHTKYGRGWVWGQGLNLVTVRFEYRGSDIGRVRTFLSNDQALSAAPLLELPGDELLVEEVEESDVVEED